MNYNIYTEKYLEAQYSISKSKQIIMLYNGIIKIVTQAIESSEKKDYQSRYNLLSKAALIVSGLQDSLDHEVDENIAIILNNYYLSIYKKMMDAQIFNNNELLKNVLEEVISMRDSWLEIDKNLQLQQSAQNDFVPKEPDQGYQLDA